MERREFICEVGLGIAAAGSLFPPVVQAKEKNVNWNVVTSWPLKMPCFQ
jgi:TRAP-type mannitol/chloroaromatic compound transport system substrate-binding protein